MPLRVPGSPKLWVPLGLLAAGVLGALLLLATAPSPETAPPPTAIPVVRTVVAETRDVQIRIASYGTVSPRSETELVPEVSGRVEWVSPSLVSGGFFEEGDKVRVAPSSLPDKPASVPKTGQRQLLRQLQSPGVFHRMQKCLLCLRTVTRPSLRITQTNQ